MYITMILDYIIKFHLQEVINILSEKDSLGYYNIKIDFLKLFESYPDVGDKVLCEPIESLPACNVDVIKAQQNLLEFDEHKETITKLNYFCLKRNVHARFFGLPVCPELHRTVFPKNVDLGCFLKVTGTVVRVTQSKMLEYQRKYVCLKCKFENSIEAEFENRYILKAPSRCRNDDPKCKSSTFTQVNLVSREHCKDYQEIKIQEQVNKLSIGTIPGSMWVVLENDLVDCCKPGDDVIICGTVRRRWRPSVQTKKSEVELVLQANYVEVSNAQQSVVVSSAPDVKDCFDEYWSKYHECPIKGRDQILMGVCPQVYGLQLVKLAVLLTVITGSNHIVEAEKTSSQEDKHATRVRGQCHLLLVGDPGTGKSQLLRAGADLTARSVFTSGAGSTRAGLTCAALREEGEWQLEAGALVLSDGGVCCIDEISQLREHDRTAIHEAMEQQTISIAKAGIVCKLNTRCAVIAACNPKGHYETDQPLAVNVSLGTPLLSRFDLIFILLDSKNKAWDKLVSSYILFGGVNTTQSKKSWNLEKLQMYISLVGPRCTEMTKTANIILQSYYMMQRKSEYRDPSRTTVRMLDSLVRLSQAHCRLMYRSTILPMDAVVAVSLVDLSMQDCTLDDTLDALHSTFQKYPDFDYLCLAKKLLTKLNLYEIWQNELLYYGKLLQIDHKTLEADVENGNPRLFAKYDDVTDDSIPLSASLVTSSYFNNKTKDKNQFENVKENKEDNTKCVNDKLAATLKKHANLNKDVNKPTVVKKTNKRKRKEVTVDITSVKNKINKRVKKSKKTDSDEDSDADLDDAKDILKAVPSVNDAFAGLGIDFNFGNSDHENMENSRSDASQNNESHTELIGPDSNNIKTTEIKSKKSNSELSKITDKTSKNKPNSNIDSTYKTSHTSHTENHDDVETTFENDKSTCDLSKKRKDNSSKSKPNTNIDSPNSSKTKDRLKQFSFNKSHDFDKYEEKPFKDKSPAKSIHKLGNVKESSCNTSSERPSVQSSQLSMFDSSDYDIDLNI